ncbi:hypothetical protein EIP86_006015 [Pleurotus ostreatoroseus]|nr:hypothetical protein EIP86_006015 [Pleurotus ostreatoroseus]
MSVNFAKLESHLATRSYIEGYVASQADVIVFKAISGEPAATYPNVVRWFTHIKSYTAEFNALPGSSTAGEAFFGGAKEEAAAEDDDEVDLFGSDDEEDAEAERIKAERVAVYTARKANKPKAVAKSLVTMEVKPWDDETDMVELERLVRSIEQPGLVWGASKLVPIGYGIKKLQITLVVEDELVSIDDLQEKVAEFEDYVQSSDIPAMQISFRQGHQGSDLSVALSLSSPPSSPSSSTLRTRPLLSWLQRKPEIMKSFAVFSLFVSVAVAESLIPSGISDGCSSYLNQLDSDTTLKSCTSALVSATSAFASSSSPSSDAVSSALSSLCSADSACSDTAIRTSLASFYSACEDELTSNINTEVLQLYDVLYTLSPLQQATCSKDDSGNFCATQIQGSAPDASSLFTSDQETLTPNFSTLEQTNAAFLYLTPDLTSDKLCTSCTRSIMTAYISFESNLAYAPGLAQSVLLSGQTALYKQISTTCGANFMNNAVQAAGSLSDSIINANSAPRAAGASAGGLASLLGAVTIAAAAML